MPAKTKTRSYTVTVQIDIEDSTIDLDAPVEESLIGELVKVKSGFYENMVYGTILTVSEI
jgi:hypothetical protein